MKNYLMGLMLFIGTIAQTQTINIETDDGNSVSISLENLESIVFDNDNLIVTSTDAECGTTYFSTFYVDLLDFEDIQLGQEDLELTSALAIYPNPANEILNIRFKNPIEAKVLIYNMLGQNVKTYQISTQETSLNISDLLAGIYLLKINNETFKFIKE